MLDANGDTTRQNQDVQTLITQGVDVVIMNANDPIGVGRRQALKKAGIPLVTVNSNLDPKLVPDSFCYVAEDQLRQAPSPEMLLRSKAIAKFGDSGTSSSSYRRLSRRRHQRTALQRLYGRLREGHVRTTRMKTKALTMKFGEWKPDKALGPIRDMATANPDLKIVFSMSDVMNGGVYPGPQAGRPLGEGNPDASYDGGMNAIKQMMDDPTGRCRPTRRTSLGIKGPGREDGPRGLQRRQSLPRQDPVLDQRWLRPRTRPTTTWPKRPTSAPRTESLNPVAAS